MLIVMYMTHLVGWIK